MDHAVQPLPSRQRHQPWVAGDAVSREAAADIEYVLRAVRTAAPANRTGSSGPGTRGPGPSTRRATSRATRSRRAAEILRAAWARDFLLGVGGDAYCAGRPSADRPWRVAVAGSRTAGRAVLAVIEVDDVAVATSGIGRARRAHLARRPTDGATRHRLLHGDRPGHRRGRRVRDDRLRHGRGRHGRGSLARMATGRSSVRTDGTVRSATPH